MTSCYTLAPGLAWDLPSWARPWRWRISFEPGWKSSDMECFFRCLRWSHPCGYCLASIAFYFNFLGPPFGIAIFCSLIALAFAAGFVALAIFVKKDNRVLFVVLSFYCLLTVWLAPVFAWNMIYLIFVARRPRKDPGKSPPTTAAVPGS